MYPGQAGPPVGAPAETCAFHPGRATGLRCTRCGRPACPECLVEATVGFHCRACIAESRASQRIPRNIAGAQLGQKPVVTFVLIGVNLLVFLVTAIQAQSGVDLGKSQYFLDGVLAPTLVASGQYWRLVTNGFLHLSVTHIALNMISLYLLGLPMERMLGRLRFVIVYLMALLGGSVTVLLLTDPLTPTAGASGAIFGLMGGLVVVFRRFRYDMRQLLGVLAINLFLSFTLSGISWQGHIGGLLVGAAMTAAMVYPPQLVRAKVQAGALVLLLVVFVGLIVVRDTQISPQCTELTVAGFSCPYS